MRLIKSIFTEVISLFGVVTLSNFKISTYMVLIYINIFEYIRQGVRFLY